MSALEEVMKLMGYINEEGMVGSTKLYVMASEMKVLEEVSEEQ